MTRNQRTLRTPVEFAGIGLHSGARIQARVLPAAPDTGVEFVRTDLPDSEPIPAQIGYYSERERRSHLQRGTASVETIEARITHLAYAPEIASAMLQRQQAGAIIAARTLIVEGAVGMVAMALEKLSSQHIVDLDEERKANMVSNLLVVLCSDKATQPVLNTGSLYQ